MTKQFKPQLAAKVKADEKKGEKFFEEMMKYIKTQVKYPVLASPKLDGIRGIVIDGVLQSRKLKPIPNKHIQKLLGQNALQALDGEIISGSPCDKEVYGRSYSAAMTEESLPDFHFYVFDIVPGLAGWDDLPFDVRFRKLNDWFKEHEASYGHLVKVVPHVLCVNADELIAFEEKCVAEGYEGAMIRSPDGKYKYGRGTLKDQTLTKVIRVEDDEFEIVGFNERMHNENEATIDALGHTKRSTHQENKTGLGDLGSFILKTKTGVMFNCSGKMDLAFRKKIWENQTDYLGMFAKVQYRPYTDYEAPRFPVFLGFRGEIDMGEVEEAA